MIQVGNLPGPSPYLVAPLGAPLPHGQPARHAPPPVGPSVGQTAPRMGPLPGSPGAAQMTVICNICNQQVHKHSIQQVLHININHSIHDNTQ